VNHLLVSGVLAAPSGLVKVSKAARAHWVNELRIRRRFGRAPLIEMNPLRESDVRRLIASARATVKDGEWFFIQR
jgi:hypothetical protein